ncbi:hypothetical protein OC5_03115 [Vibrio cyclitrophicus ZF264]|uniref:O-antigen ligase family protein n=1 Tax=Vibrio cyclitrophicus TaxID=47951 RepID=UPI00030D078E|nr:O-antigen ligase family protein [Vibrio cyclitrophicus]OEE04357.1 hypothetical protein OC5_03115 [Vibrio cyclitrophicus ZF264]
MINLAFFLFFIRIISISLLPNIAGMINIAGFIGFTSLTVVWYLWRSDFYYLKKYVIYEICLILILFVSIFISSFNGLIFSDSIEAFLKFFIIFSSLNLGLLCGKKIERNAYFKVIYYSLFTHVLLGILLSKFGFVHEVHGVERITGISGGVQIYANLISFLFVLSYYLIFYKVNFISRNFLIIAIITCILAFAMSNTLKNFAVSILVISIPYLFNKKKFFKFLLFSLFILIPLVVVSFPYLKELSLFERIQSIYDAGLSTQLAPGEKLESSLIWRLIHWKLLLIDWFENYFFFGSGVGQSVNMNALVTANGNGFEAHSDIVTFVVEFGLVLTPIIVFMMFYPLYNSCKLALSNKDDITICVLFAFLSSFIASFFGNVFYSLANIYYLWFFVGWTLGRNGK